MNTVTLLFAVLRCSSDTNGRAEECVMILVRFAIGVFALTLLGMAFSLSSVHSQPVGHAPAAITPR
jgi:hypothetical protein